MLTRSLSRMTSKSSLWRSWTSNPVADYENTMDKYPWLAKDATQPSDCHNHTCMRRTGQISAWELDMDSLLQTPEESLYGHEQRQPYEPSVSSSASVASQAAVLEDPNLVTWTGPDDPMNPHNWPRSRKWSSTLLVSCFTFISPIASTMLAPALPTMADELDTSSGLETYLLMSIFLLAYAVGPFVLAPLSEMYGRVVVLQSANLVFLLFNTVCGFATTKQQMLAFRFLSGLGGAAPQALGGGVLSDCWKAEERGRATAVYSLAPFLGPAIGPVAAGYLVQHASWRWIFWTVSIADALVQVLALLFLPETYRPKILAVKARRLRRATGNPDLHTEFDRPDRSFARLLGQSLARPLIMLATQPTIQLTGLYRAYLYGLMYLVLASFPMVWEQQYGQAPGRASLNYLSLGVGFVVGLQVSGPLIDRVYRALKAKHNHPGRPEFRVPLMFPTAIIAPGGLLLYGLAAHHQTHWIVPNIGAALFALGLILSFQCAQTYVVDAYETYAASATGAAAFIRTMAGFGFPLFAPGLYDALGIARGNALLAGVAALICVLAPAVLWRYGERIRGRSQFCAG
ncbi:uncharacterized protein J7T54_005489 [Emericellopsis cladophorae]|uniref:Major facilitator superfamily (MFS) profile domain-containing protein n=1 Tax=Emericellopsis cladophorae TaxID=2686198 RepID=A0A9P9Y505_9HYPO|nr:uncharacterized protein J7T54_005489 [Emericellopsis cladophorae]KAI6783460.1 hypothetical protein J7T54_005489 [Emericellopsis cladophorae]